MAARQAWRRPPPPAAKAQTSPPATLTALECPLSTFVERGRTRAAGTTGGVRSEWLLFVAVEDAVAVAVDAQAEARARRHARVREFLPRDVRELPERCVG